MKPYEQLKALYDEIDILIGHRVWDESPEFIRWHKKTERFLKSFYGEGDEYNNFITTSFSLSVWGVEEESAYIGACAKALAETKAVFEVYLEELSEDEVEEENRVNNPSNSIKDNTKVFVVHGHDGELLQSIARTLEKQGIETIILSEMPNLGATIIEKFERYSDVKAAICLFTEDDCGRAKEEPETRPRARQNVVFEAGYFIGKLGRENVILLANREIEMPSDLSGVVYSDNEMWQLQVLKELREMGFNIDLNKA